MSSKRISDLAGHQVAALLREGKLEIDLGPFRVAIRSEVQELGSALQQVYGNYPFIRDSDFVDMRIALLQGQGFRRLLGPQIRLFIDGIFPFEPFPISVHLPFLEWGMNWRIANRTNIYLLLHAGVVEKNGWGIILSALPGSGKSTLTAALVARGYRHFSDEFGVVRLTDNKLLPLLRPIGLKNQSIPVIKSLASDVAIGPVFHNTRKGDVAHMAPTLDSVDRRNEPADPRLIVFPKFVSSGPTELTPLSPSRAFSRLSVNSFNYELLGVASFDALADIVERSPAYSLRYSDIASAIRVIDELIA